MTTPTPTAGEPFSEALAEVAQTTAMSIRPLLTIADAVRRAAQKHHKGKEDQLGEEAGKLAPGWSAEQLRDVVPGPALMNLMKDTDWQVTARQLASL
ncbi:hypothetical protein ACIRJR_33125 [Streptomyces sp. NPDC102402]|uniref:hypothetical protein n=1 Tax=Streptomyces sp. NPDC102402 TaxID=3366169 RepID=UPI00382B0DBF